MKNIILSICVLFPLICHAKTNDWQLIHAHYYPQDKKEKHIQKIYLDKASIKTSDGDIREFTTINTYPNGYLNPSNKVEKKKDEYGTFRIKCSNATGWTDLYNIDTNSEYFGKTNKGWSPIFTKISVITNVAYIPALAFYDVCFDRISKDFNSIIFR